MPKELLEFDMTKPPGASWGIRICGGADRGKVLTIEKVQLFFTLGQKPTFYPEIPKNLMFEKCEFCEK